jgi:putative transposase
VRATRGADWTDRRRGRRPLEDAWLVDEIRFEIAALASYDYRRACALVNRRREATGGRRVNPKRAYRVMDEHGLLLQRYTGRPTDTRSHDGKVAVERSNMRWCSDGFEIACDNTERVRVAFALDCCDREVLSWVATTGGIGGAMVRDLMVEAVEKRFGQVAPPTPVEWLTDNGSPYVARDTRAFAHEIGLIPLTTALRKMDRRDACTVLLQLEPAFAHYNEVHPHSALKMLSPRMFRQKQAQLRSLNGCGAHFIAYDARGETNSRLQRFNIIHIMRI